MGGDRTTLTVLVVEDSEGIRRSTADILRLQEYDVIEAADGIEGVQKLQSEDVDVLILDLDLPRLDGIGVLDALSRLPVVIIVSAFEYFDEAVMRARFGPDVFAYLQKPVPPKYLLEVLAEATSGFRS